MQIRELEAEKANEWCHWWHLETPGEWDCNSHQSTMYQKLPPPLSCTIFFCLSIVISDWKILHRLLPVTMNQLQTLARQLCMESHTEMRNFSCQISEMSLICPRHFSGNVVIDRFIAEGLVSGNEKCSITISVFELQSFCAVVLWISFMSFVVQDRKYGDRVENTMLIVCQMFFDKFLYFILWLVTDCLTQRQHQNKVKVHYCKFVPQMVI